MIALAFREVRSAWARPVFGVWLAISVGIGVIGALLPGRRLLFSDPHGYARVLELLQAGAPLAASFPTFTTEDWRAPLVTLLPWLTAGVLAIAALAVVARIATRRSALWLGVFASLVFLIGAAVANAKPSGALRDDTVRQGALDLIWNWDPTGQYAFAYGANTRVDEARL